MESILVGRHFGFSLRTPGIQATLNRVKSELAKVALTPAEFAALFGKSQTWGYRQLYSGKVKAITDFGRTLIPVSEVERVLGKAGRYLGSGVSPEKGESLPKKTAKALKKNNPWKEAVGKRRRTAGALRTRKSRNVRGHQDPSMLSLRQAALRKLNRKRSD